MADYSTGLSSVFEHAIAADPLKFVIFFLMAYSIYQGRGASKIQDTLLKFISDKMDKIERVVDDAKSSMNQSVDRIKDKLDEQMKTIVEFERSITESIFKNKGDYLKDIEEYRKKFEEIRRMIDDYGVDNSMVVKAMAEQKQMMDEIKKSYNKFLNILQDKKDGK